MKRRAHFEIPPLDLIEEAFHLVRRSEARTLLCHLIGSLPFLLGVLYFWSDMARGIDAADRLPAAALALTGQFFWLKIWQAIYAQQLLAQLRGEPRWAWNWPKLGRLILAQVTLQPAGLFLLPVTLVLTVPFGWAFAFFQSVSALGGEEDGARSQARQAWKVARLWPMQNHQILAIFVLFGFFVFLNVLTAALAIPFLVKMLFGIESAITRSPGAALNTTFIASAVALTWLCVDPFLKAAYVLRCFHGHARRTGADLLADLRRPLIGARSGLLLAMALLCLAGSARQSSAAESASARPPAAASVQPERLDRAIGDVMQQREYSWRLPRDKQITAKKEQGWLGQFIDSIFETIEEALKKVGGWLDDLWRWVFKPPTFKPGAGPVLDWTAALKGLFIVLCVACLGFLVLLLFRAWQRHRRVPPAAIMASAVAAPDLADENVGADQLPEDGWLRLGREMMGGGDLRLALRAFYLASLAHLADRNLITLTRFKSNLDYARELRRRSHALPQLIALFGENVPVFERVWYGRHEASRELVGEFSQRVERMRTGS